MENGQFFLYNTYIYIWVPHWTCGTGAVRRPIFTVFWKSIKNIFSEHIHPIPIACWFSMWSFALKIHIHTVTYSNIHILSYTIYGKHIWKERTVHKKSKKTVPPWRRIFPRPAPLVQGLEARVTRPATKSVPQSHADSAGFACGFLSADMTGFLRMCFGGSPVFWYCDNYICHHMSS
jgi:hypothetical protein